MKRLTSSLARWWHCRQGRWWWATLVIVVPILCVTSVAALLMSRIVDIASSATQIEAIRTILTVGAGTGGVVALVLAGRRQWSNEQAHDAADHDASERRITELYTKAVDQLGSNQAAVRLGGLYALERLGNANQSQQRAIGNVICAYLRMPPAASDDPSLKEGMSRQEREVRQTAIDILCEHYRTADGPWPKLMIQLQRANLDNMDLSGTRLSDANFSGADLTGVNLEGTYLRCVEMEGADLTDANLSGATLRGAYMAGVYLTDADLSGADMREAILTDADFTGANLSDADLTAADIRGAILDGANLRVAKSLVGLRRDNPHPAMLQVAHELTQGSDARNSLGNAG